MSLESALIKMASENPELAEDVIDILAAADDDYEDDFYADDDSDDDDFYADEDEDFYAEDEEDDEVDIVEAMLHLAAEGGSGAKRKRKSPKKRLSGTRTLIPEVANAAGKKQRGKAKSAFVRLFHAYLMDTNPELKEAQKILKNTSYSEVKEDFKKWVKETHGPAMKAHRNKRDTALFEEVHGRSPSGGDLKKFRSQMTRQQKTMGDLLGGKRYNVKDQFGKKIPGAQDDLKRTRRSVGGSQPPQLRRKQASLADILGY